MLDIIELQKGSEYMYQLNKFCNIIYNLRKERGWTQTTLAERLGISPQSVSKWECGIGYPDVILFPMIAELFDVPIGVLFGETNEEEMEVNLDHERKFVFEPLNHIEIRVGNQCQIEVINGERDHSSLDVEGDTKFIEYFLVEKADGKLRVNVKNPTGSDTYWLPYNRGNYTKNNKIVIHSGVSSACCTVVNYLDLEIYDCFTTDDTYKWVCKKTEK